MNPTTQLVLQLIGPAFLVFGLGMFFNQEYYAESLKSMMKSKAFILWAGFVNLVVGPALLVHHWKWGSVEEVVVTVIGISATLKGLHIILFPRSWKKMVKNVINKTFLSYGAIAVAAIGLAMTYAGYFSA